MLGRCTLDTLENGFREILNNREFYEDQESYIKILNRAGNIDIVSDDSHEIISDFRLYNSTMDGVIYVMCEEKLSNDGVVRENEIQDIECH